MTATVDILIKATDAASAVLRTTTNATNDVASAMTRLIVQERNNQILAEAQRQFAGLTQTEKKYALAAYDAAAATNAQGDAQKNNGNAFTELKSKIDLARTAVQTFVQGYQEVMAFGKAGAELDYTQRKFDRLSESVGTTSDAMIVQLRGATRGMVSDSALVSSAADLMGLGLAKTSDQVVRLTTVSGALGMDMNQLVLTLANQTTMRFDQLGVSVDGFDERLAKLKASGMDANSAFTEAFLQQAEAQMDKIGSKADTGAAAFVRLDVATQNLGDSMKRTAAPAITALAEGLTFLLTSSEQATAAINSQSSDVAKGAGSYEDYVAQMEASLSVQGIRIEMINGEARALTGHSSGLRDVTGQVNLLTRAQYGAARAVEAEGGAILNTTGELNRYAQRASQSRTANIRNLEVMRQQRAAYDQLADAARDVEQAQANFNKSFGSTAAQALQKYTGDTAKYREGLLAIDQATGQNLTAQYDNEKAMDALMKQFSQGKISSAELAQGLQDQKPAWQALDDNIQKTKRSLNDALNAWKSFIANIGGADGMTVTITVDTVTSGGGGGGSNPSDYSGQTCFVGETPVNTPTGYRPIANLDPGDVVTILTAGGLTDTALIVAKHSSFRDDLLRVTTSDNQSFSCTPDHPWRANGRFTLAARLKPGDKLTSLRGRVTVLKVELEPGTFEVFDITVDHEEHTFLVGGIVVHNKLAGGGPVYAGKPEWVGELGPEPFIPTRPGYVLSRSDAMAAFAASQGGGGGGGGITIVMNNRVEGILDWEAAAARLARKLANRMR